MATALLIIHSLVAVALLGAITHQTLATWVPARARSGSFFGRFRSVPSPSFTNAIVVLYSVAALLGAIVYLYFRVDIDLSWSKPATGRPSVSSTSRSTSLPSGWDCCQPTGFSGRSQVPPSPPEPASR